MKNRSFLSLLVVGAGAMPVSVRLEAAIQIESLEVTQCIQTVDNKVPLVAGRSTVVRVTINTGSPAPVPGIKGKLRVFVGGLDVTEPSQGITAANQPFQAPVAPERKNQNHTLNFIVPKNVCKALKAGSKAKFKVEIDVPTNAGNLKVSSETKDLEILLPFPLRIFFIRIEYSPNGNPTWVPQSTDVDSNGADMVRAILPVDDHDGVLYEEIPGKMTFPVYEDPNGNKKIDDGEEKEMLFAILDDLRSLIVEEGYGPNENTLLFGWVKEDRVVENGWAMSPGRYGFGNTNVAMYQRTLAHEVSHMLGYQPHNPYLTIQDVGWDVTGKLSTNGDPIKPTSLYDIMKGGMNTNQAWIDRTTYETLLNYAQGFPLPPPDDLPDDQIIEGWSGWALRIQGAFDREGKALRFLNPVFRFPWRSRLTPANPNGPYRAVLKGESGKEVSLQFDAGAFFDEKKVKGFFTLTIPFPKDEGVAEVCITDAAGNPMPVAARVGKKVSNPMRRPPELPKLNRKLPAKPVKTFEGLSEVSFDWTGTGDDRIFLFAYSEDEGKTFRPLGVNFKEPRLKLSLPERLLKGKPPLVRVFGSDGLRDDSNVVERE